MTIREALAKAYADSKAHTDHLAGLLAAYDAEQKTQEACLREAATALQKAQTLATISPADLASNVGAQFDVSKDDGWIEWEGGKCPVGSYAPVDLDFGDGMKVLRAVAGDYNWRVGTDIIAYRIVKEG